jgi:hypothetical protein
MRNTLPILVLFAVTAGCGTSGTPTHRFWNELRDANASASIAGNGVVPGQTAEQLVASMRRVTQAMRDAGSRINRQPTEGVDPEAVDFAADVALLLQDTSSAASATAELTERAVAFGQYSRSAGVFAESMIRGYLGDPFGKAQEIHVASSQLSSEWQRVETRLRQLQTRADTLAAREMRLRSALVSRHGGEFQPLSTQPTTSTSSEPSKKWQSSHPKIRQIQEVYNYLGIVGIVVVGIIILIVCAGVDAIWDRLKKASK